jgi:hypothetical protein
MDKRILKSARQGDLIFVDRQRFIAARLPLACPQSCQLAG